MPLLKMSSIYALNEIPFVSCVAEKYCFSKGPIRAGGKQKSEFLSYFCNVRYVKTKIDM